MTGGAFLWRGFVEEYSLAFDRAGQLVASFAANILMSSLQWKRSPLVMVKQRWLPLCTVVTLGARRDRSLGKLSTMDVLVAFLTSRRRGFEVHIDQTRLLIGWLVAIHACCGPMRANQRKGSLGVIETCQLLP